MSSYLNLDDYSEFFPEKEGEEIKIHHCREGRGNNRFYIKLKREPHGLFVVGYCFHCGGKGRRLVEEISAKGLKERLLALRTTGTSKEVEFISTRSADMIEDFLSWPVDARRWWLKNSMKSEEAMKHNLYYDCTLKGVSIPLIYKGKQVGVSTRTILGDGPKYVFKGEKMISGALLNDEPNSVCVLVEDFKSAVKVQRVATCIPLLGTNLRDEHVAELLWIDKRRIVVLLDNDSDLVKNKAREMRKRLDGIFHCQVSLSSKDPKTHTTAELKDIIYGTRHTDVS